MVTVSEVVTFCTDAPAYLLDVSFDRSNRTTTTSTNINETNQGGNRTYSRIISRRRRCSFLTSAPVGPSRMGNHEAQYWLAPRGDRWDGARSLRWRDTLRLLKQQVSKANVVSKDRSLPSKRPFFRWFIQSTAMQGISTAWRRLAKWGTYHRLDCAYDGRPSPWTVG